MIDREAAIGIVGAGRVATTLGALLFERGAPVVAVSSRTAASAVNAARAIGSTVRAASLAELSARAGRVLIATSDDSISSVAEDLAASGFRGVALHTCGARGPEALQRLRELGVACGVLHPLQTFAPIGARTDLLGVAVVLVGDPAALQWGGEIVRAIEGRPLVLAPESLPLYHAGAVLAGNAIVAVVDAAVRVLAAAGITEREARSALGPLCRASLENTLRDGPVAALTGPVVRGDVQTVRLHLEALEGGPAHAIDLYRGIGRWLMAVARRRGTPEERLSALETALEVGEAGADHAR
jgi:predicted short-subunit dehydrogenase-like oxidoreductase (DUF2520 family)